MEQPHQETGNRLRRLEAASGLNGARLASLTQNRIRQSRWTEYCQGKRLITVEAALELHKLTGVTLDYIYRGDLSGLPQRLISAIGSEAA